MKIAVIGSGISGAAAAWALSATHDVTIFESDDRPGGHAATVDIDYDGKKISVDTGFIVFNEINYPQLTRLFDHLGVDTRASKMTFAVSLDDGRLEWCGGARLSGVFAQRRNLFSIGFLGMLRDIFRFNSRALRDLRAGVLCGLSLNDYLNRAGFSERLREHYLVPMASAIWSTPSSKMLEFPAESLVRFMKNHHLTQLVRPRWRTVEGGSREYVSRLFAASGARLVTGTAIVTVERCAGGVLLTDQHGQTHRFDQVVMAAHSDQSLSMLKHPSQAEHEILSAVRYSENEVILHRDSALMPRRRKAWGAWNYIGAQGDQPERDVTVTYWMNALQGIDPKCPLFITLNPLEDPDPDLVFGRYTYAHPLFDAASVEAQGRLSEIQGKDRIWYCGAWCGYGFHEDGLSSGLSVARALGAEIPWESGDAIPVPAENQVPELLDAAE